MSLTQVCIMVAAVAYLVAAVAFAKKGQWMLAVAWFSSFVSVAVWSFVKETK